MDKGYIVRWQSDLVYTTESVLPVCDQPNHMNNGFQQRKICGTMHSLKQFKLFACCRNWPRPRFLLVEGQKLGFKKQFAKSFISVVFLIQCF